MTPQEKAMELVKKMYLAHSNSYSDITNHLAKQCALIAVDEIIEALRNNAANSESWLYYEEVKNEIEKI